MKISKEEERKKRKKEHTWGFVSNFTVCDVREEDSTDP